MTKRTTTTELPEFVAREALAAALDLTPRRVSSLVSEGIFPRPAQHGQYPLVPCLHAYMSYLRQRATGAGVATETLTSERAKLTKAKAEIAEMERKRLAGELTSMGQVGAGWTAILKVIRSNFLALPNRAALVLATMNDPRRIAAYLTERVHEVLESTSQTRFVVGTRGSAGADDDEGDHADLP